MSLKIMIDLILKEGKITVGNSLEKEVRDILFLKKGHQKFSPLLGVGIDNFIDSELDDDALFSIVAAEMKRDSKQLVSGRLAGDIYISDVRR